LVVLFSLAILVGCKTATEIEPERSDLKKLHGTWKVTARAENEKASAADKSTTLPLMEGDVVVVEDAILTTKSGAPLRLKVTMENGKEAKEATLVEVDEKGKTVQNKQGAEPMTEYRHRGVYKLDGDTLTLTLAPVNVRERPKSVGAKDRGLVSLTLKKTKSDARPIVTPTGDKSKEDDKKKEEPKKEDDKSKKGPPPSEFGEK